MSKLTEDLMKQLRFVSAASNSFMDDKKQKFRGRDRVLVILAEEDGMNQGYLAEILDLRPSSLAELLKKMEYHDDIKRVEDEKDKRTKKVFLTEKGQAKAAELAKLKVDQSEDFFKGLTEEEQTAFNATLKKIADGWDEELRNKSDRFVDPMERLQFMRGMRDSFMDKVDGELSVEELRDLKRKMQREMRGQFDKHIRGRFHGNSFEEEEHHHHHHHDDDQAGKDCHHHHHHEEGYEAEHHHHHHDDSFEGQCKHHHHDKRDDRGPRTRDARRDDRGHGEGRDRRYGERVEPQGRGGRPERFDSRFADRRNRFERGYRPEDSSKADFQHGKRRHPADDAFGNRPGFDKEARRGGHGHHHHHGQVKPRDTESEWKDF